MRTIVLMALVSVALALVACSTDRDLGGTTGSVHAIGILDPDSGVFHGKLLSQHGWDVSFCMRCHDATKSGGAPACTTCHEDGPNGCSSCHSMPPNQGAHHAHAPDGTPDECAKCHPVPTHWMDPGHLGDAPRFAFEPLAGANATFDGTRCQNVYCHGAGFANAGGTNTSPAWKGGPGEAACGSCHGKPPADHGGGYACATCHPADAPHVDGTVEVGSTCDGCHGSKDSPAPPRDLSGNMLSTALGVGAHQAHLNVPTHLRGPIACATCHQVPTAVGDAGHIDSPPPAEVNAVIGWDRTSATCTVECHGAQSPVWTTTGGVYCGSCHGVPPADVNHDPNLQISDCHTCHTRSVDAAGFPIVHPDGTSEHINGTVDF